MPRERSSGAQDERRSMRTKKSCGPGCRCCSQALRRFSSGPTGRGELFNSRSDGDKKNSSPGRARRTTLRPLRRQGRDASGFTCIFPVRTCAFFSARGLRVPAGSRSCLRPPLKEGCKKSRKCRQNSGAVCRENANACARYSKMRCVGHQGAKRIASQRFDRRSALRLTAPYACCCGRDSHPRNCHSGMCAKRAGPKSIRPHVPLMNGFRARAKRARPGMTRGALAPHDSAPSFRVARVCNGE